MISALPASSTSLVGGDLRFRCRLRIAAATSCAIHVHRTTSQKSPRDSLEAAVGLPAMSVEGSIVAQDLHRATENPRARYTSFTL